VTGIGASVEGVSRGSKQNGWNTLHKPRTLSRHGFSIWQTGRSLSWALRLLLKPKRAATHGLWA
jgi:hypothetical protein